MSDDICLVCGNNAYKSGVVSKAFQVTDKLYLIRDIPALLCTRCGEPVFTLEVAEQIRKMIHEPHQPEKIIPAELLTYTAA